MVVNEMRGEKIDIVPLSEDLADFVAKALSPAKVTQVNISEDGTAADVIVPDHQLSLAIGREGQNARLSARLTGVRVDIRSETQLAEGIPAGHGRDSDVEYAVGEWRPNAETGENEWHAADGSVISESEWNKQAEAAQAEAEAAAAADAEIPEVLEELKAGPWAGSVMHPSSPKKRQLQRLQRLPPKQTRPRPKLLKLPPTKLKLPLKQPRQTRQQMTKRQLRKTTKTFGPVRSCIGCRTQRPHSELIRITRSFSGITVDGSSSGRGAWVCRDQRTHGVAGECLDTAITQRAFARAWRSDVSDDDITNIKEQASRP